MKYIVIPKKPCMGSCRTVCKTAASAENEKKKLEVLTGSEGKLSPSKTTD